jgi:hypothetical protein
MPETTAAAEVSMCVCPGGDAAVFVTRPAEAAPLPLSPARLAAALKERGLRLVGLSSSPRAAPGPCAGARTTSVTSGSLLDAVLSLVGEPRAAVA